MEQLQLPLLWFMLAAYVGALVIYGFSFWSRNGKMRNLATRFVYVGLALTTAALVLRAALIGGLPLNNGFEFGLSFVFAVVVAYVIVEKKFNLSAVRFLFCQFILLNLNIREM